MLIKFTYVDAITGVSMIDAPCANGPVLPALAGIAIDFSNASEWPCDAPVFYGHCNAGADPTHPGVIDVLTQEVFDASRTAEMNRRQVIASAALQTAREAKNNEINAARLAATFTTFGYAGKVISSDQLSRSDIDGINGYVALNDTFPPAFTGGWKCTDNSYVPIATIAEWKEFYGAMVEAGSANFAHSETLKSALAAATTADEVAAVSW